MEVKRKIKRIKLKQVLENYDGLLKIFIYNNHNNEEEELYYGHSLDCPYWIADHKIHTDRDGEGLFVGVDANTLKPYLGVYIFDCNYEYC